MWNVWRTVLEENEKLARARLAAVEVFQQQIADDAKILRAHKLQTAKKVNIVLELATFLSNCLGLRDMLPEKGLISVAKGEPYHQKAQHVEIDSRQAGKKKSEAKRCQKSRS